MNYSEWLSTVSPEITNDPIWEYEAYRLSLFASDIGWRDVLALSKIKLMVPIAEQLHLSIGLISANLSEGYSRSKTLDRERHLEIALGVARESRDWYYKSKQILSAEIIQHRMGLMTHIIGLLAPVMYYQEKNVVREEQAPYQTNLSIFSIYSEIPFPQD